MPEPITIPSTIALIYHWPERRLLTVYSRQAPSLKQQEKPLYSIQIMDIKIMRAIDAYAGAIFCFFLSLFHRFKKIFFMETAVAPQKIVVLKFLGLGSLLLTYKLINSLKSSFPNVKISIVTFESNRELLEMMNCFYDIYTLRADSLVSFTKDALKVLRQIRSWKTDTVIDLEFFTKFSTIFTYLTGATNRVGYYAPQNWRGDLLTCHVHFNHYKHITDVFASSAEKLGATRNDTKFNIHIPESAMTACKTKLKELGVEENEKVIIVNPNTSALCIERRWKEEYFTEIILHIIDKNYKVVLIGAEEDKAIVAQIVSFCGGHQNLVNLSGRLNIQGLMALFKVGSLLITNDSGPLHMASFCDIPTISFFGPETPILYGPLGKQHKVFFKGLYCSPCMNVYNAKLSNCNGKNLCMEKIHPVDVIKYVDKILSHWEKLK